MKKLADSIKEEVRLLDKKCELLQLRISEAGKSARAEYLRVTGRELWSCARRLEKLLQCKRCEGTGEISYLGEKEGCPDCKGTGERLIFQ